MTDNALGDYLRARRESLRPSDVGIAESGRPRRVAGLRREEVAALAGISPEYYLRLEQGRERHPSEQVVSGIAQALRLTRAGEEFLHRLVRPLPERAHDSASNPIAADRLEAFVMALSEPAFAHDRVLEVIVANPLATALGGFLPGQNLLRAVFLQRNTITPYRNWPEMTERLVSYLRAQAAVPPLDPRLPALVAELSAGSERFAELWAQQQVGALSSGTNTLDHPLVGELEINYERLVFAGTDYPVIIVYHAEPGSPSELAMANLLVLTSNTGEPAQ